MMDTAAFFIGVVPVLWIDLWRGILPVAGFVIGGYLWSLTWR